MAWGPRGRSPRPSRIRRWSSRNRASWLLHRAPVILPIPGTSSAKHLEEKEAAAGVTLSDAEWNEIADEANLDGEVLFLDEDDFLDMVHDSEF